MKHSTFGYFLYNNSIRITTLTQSDEFIPGFTEQLITLRRICYKSPGIYQIPAELNRAGGKTLGFAIHKSLHFIWKKDELTQQKNASIITFLYKKSDKVTVIIIEKFHIKYHPIFFS
jgi:hypothetical protein